MTNDYDIEALQLYYIGDSLQDYFLRKPNLHNTNLNELSQKQKKFIESLN